MEKQTPKGSNDNSIFLILRLLKIPRFFTKKTQLLENQKAIVYGSLKEIVNFKILIFSILCFKENRVMKSTVVKN